METTVTHVLLGNHRKSHYDFFYKVLIYAGVWTLGTRRRTEYVETEDLLLLRRERVTLWEKLHLSTSQEERIIIKRRINWLSKEHRKQMKFISMNRWEIWRRNFIKAEPVARWRLLAKKVKATTRTKKKDIHREQRKERFLDT